MSCDSECSQVPLGTPTPDFSSPCLPPPSDITLARMSQLEDRLAVVEANYSVAMQKIAFLANKNNILTNLYQDVKNKLAIAIANLSKRSLTYFDGYQVLLSNYASALSATVVPLDNVPVAAKFAMIDCSVQMQALPHGAFCYIDLRFYFKSDQSIPTTACSARGNNSIALDAPGSLDNNRGSGVIIVPIIDNTVKIEVVRSVSGPAAASVVTLTSAAVVGYIG